ncbi:DUF3102 domain-containing protein [Enterococcus devriesei]|uniref:DUF3102 domain-containing protein n=1 Tax=Enterococcus devriesei TaxID=319970 RepID=A0A1L8SWL5_9ENTE|nr:DUF3102 domain-containing protein [Enterococcus devriesei]OJG36234.1 hypothetical protein RV00_GL001593 [Enterococcus devriesei]
MNEIQLSKDINILTAEINSYKQIAGQSIWEIGRRLNYVKENDLVHGEFGKWLKKINIEHSEANRFMKVAQELPNYDTWQNLGNRALYLVATLPEEERTQPHETAKGETKTPDEMTVRELQELKKQLKAKDKQIDNLSDVINDMSVQQPEVVEKEIVIEKIPDDYENLKTTNEQLEKQLSSVRNDLKMKKMQYDLLEQNTESAKTLEANIKALQQKEKSIDQRVKATIEFNDLMREIETFFDTKMASLRFKPLINDLYDTEASNKLSEVVNSVDFWVSEMRKIIPNEKTKIIEGEIING